MKTMTKVMIFIFICYFYISCGKNDPLGVEPPASADVKHDSIEILSDPNIFPILSELYIPTVYANYIGFGPWGTDWTSPVIATGIISTTRFDNPDDGNKAWIMEGNPESQAVHGNTYWGMGAYHTGDVVMDLSAWSNGNLVLWAKGDANVSTVQIAIIDSDSEMWFALTSRGFIANNTWQEIIIPITAFTGIDMSIITVPVAFKMDPWIEVDGKFYVDFVRYER